MKIKHRFLVPLLLLFVLVMEWPLQAEQKDFYLRGALYFDWFGAQYEGSDFFHQLSSRLKLEMVNRRGGGWTFLLDARNRWRLSDNKENRALLYDARILFDKLGSPLFLSLGQMNLYDTAGIGQLLGGVAGYKISRDLLLGGYAGLESSIYVNRLDNHYQKYGLFGRYQGTYGRRLSLSYNQLMNSGSIERRYIYAGTMFPFVKRLTFYGNLEYELASYVRNEDRLSRAFVNVRWDPSRSVDMTAFLSSGRGLDFHRYILEKSQDPTLNDTELERFYYSRQYGIRLSLKPVQRLRLSVSRMEREQKDQGVRNHTWRFGGSGGDILKTGVTLYGNYTLNRGEMSESDSYYVAVSKDFGRVSWYGSYSNTFNGIRFDHGTETPQVIHLNDYRTFTTQLFIPITRLFAVSLEYEYFLQKESNQHLFFVRLIFKK